MSLKRARTYSQDTQSSLHMITSTVKESGGKAQYYVNDSTKQLSKKDIPVSLIKTIIFPEYSFYFPMYYPCYMTYNDNPFAAFANMRQSTDASTGNSGVGLLKASQTAATNQGYGLQILAQFPILTHLEFALLHHKLARDQTGNSLYAGVTAMDISNTNREAISSPWYRGRRLFLQKFEKTYRITNNKNCDVYVELIVWQPKRIITEVHTYASTTDNTYATNQNSTPLGFLAWDLSSSSGGTGSTDLLSNYYPPQSGNFSNLGNSEEARTNIRIDLKSNTQLNSSYKKLHKKLVKLGPGETIVYNVSIPGQLLSTPEAPVNSDRNATTFYRNVIAYQKFTRFLTVRAYAYAGLNSVAVLETNADGQLTYADVELSVVASGFIKASWCPFLQRPITINSANPLEWSGQAVNSTQLITTAAAADQTFIQDTNSVTTMTGL